jgi:hypothetical protein
MRIDYLLMVLSAGLMLGPTSARADAPPVLWEQANDYCVRGFPAVGDDGLLYLVTGD